MIKESRVDEALVHLFTTRMKLGMFDGKGKTPFDSIPYTAVDSSKMRALNRKASAKSVVLLKMKIICCRLIGQRLKPLESSDPMPTTVGRWWGITKERLPVM